MSSKIKLTSDEMQYIALAQSVTGVTAKDCIIDKESNKIIFVTPEKEAGLAVGKSGSNVKTLRKITGRDIEIIEFADSGAQFIKNAFNPARIKDIRISERLDGRKIAVVNIDPRDKGIAIGRGGERAERVRQLAKKYFEIDNVVIT